MKQGGKHFPLRLFFHEEIKAWAEARGISMNSAINQMIAEGLTRDPGEIERLKAENEELRSKIVSVIMSMPGRVKE
jgi:hypothetical protein